MSTAASPSSRASAAEPQHAGDDPAPAPHRRGRLAGAFPAVGLTLLVLTFYWVEAALRKSPWVFTDELEWSQLSRSIAETGHAARRGVPFSSQSLYSYLIAPAWWLHTTAASYAAIKYLNAVVMCLAAVPTYLLGRMLVPRRSALIVAFLSISIPAMSYATSIIPEPLAYPWFTLAAWLCIRALARPSIGSALPAIAVVAVGPLIRQELTILAAVLVLGAVALWLIRHGEARDTPLPARQLAIAAVFLSGFGYVFYRLVVSHFANWEPGRYIDGHTLESGRLAAGALVIGMGVLPVIGGLASLALRERWGDPLYRAYAVYVATMIVVIWSYTAAKATLLRDTAGVLIEERNLFYLAPLLLLGTALVLEARRISWWIVAVPTALVVAACWPAFLQQRGAPYFEAPGLAIVALVNRNFGWTIETVRFALVGAAVASVALITLRRRRAAPAIAAAVVFAWMLTGQVYETRANNLQAERTASAIPPDRSWIDEHTHGEGVTFLGQTVGNTVAFWLTEFWNHSLHHVASLDGTASGPGPTFIPGLDSTDGLLNEATGDPYVLASPGIVPVGTKVASGGGLTLYRVVQPWRLKEAVQNVYRDGWATTPATYAYYPKGGPGTVVVNLSRTAYRGDAPAGRVTIKVGELTFVDHSGPQLGRTRVTRHALIPNGGTTTVRIRVEATPVFVVVSVSNPIAASGDSRQLAAQETFSFRPARSGG